MEVEKIKYVERPVEVIKEVPVVEEVRWFEKSTAGLVWRSFVYTSWRLGILGESLGRSVVAAGLAGWNVQGFYVVNFCAWQVTDLPYACPCQCGFGIARIGLVCHWGCTESGGGGEAR